MVNVLGQGAKPETVESRLEPTSAPDKPGVFRQFTSSVGARFALAGALFAGAAGDLPAQPKPDKPAGPTVEVLAVPPRPVPPRSVEEYLAREYGHFDGRVRELVAGLGDKEFRKREKAQAALQKLRRDALQYPQIGTFNVAAYVRDNGKNLEPEQLHRLGQLDGTLRADRRPTFVPEIKTDAMALLSILAQQTKNGLRLDAGEEAEQRLKGHVIELSSANNTFWQIVGQLEKAGQLHVRLEDGSVTLTDKGKPTLEFLAASGKAAIFLKPSEKKSESPTLIIAFEPGMPPPLHVLEGRIGRGPVQNIPVDVPHGQDQTVAKHREVYPMSPPGQAVLARESDDFDEKPRASIDVCVTHAKSPGKGRIVLGDPSASAATLGRQTITVHKIVRSVDGTCVVILQNQAWGDLCWNHTKHEWDRSNYVMAGMSKPTFTTATGKPLDAKQESMKIDREHVWTTYKLAQEPQAIDIEGHGDFAGVWYYFDIPTEKLPTGKPLPEAAPKPMEVPGNNVPLAVNGNGVLPEELRDLR